MDSALFLAITEQMLRYGAPAVIAAIQEMDKEDPTAEDILALQIDKGPEDYFNDPQGA